MQPLHKRFFESTRGRVLKLLCGSTRTVMELAERLQLTDNGVRAHLASLERDGLVHQKGLRRGTRKPNFAYELTPAGHQLFPKAHAPVLAAVMDVLSDELEKTQAEKILHDTGARLAEKHLPGLADLPTEKRVTQLMAALDKTGLIAEVEQKPDHTIVTGCSCPLSDVIIGHPELCTIAAKLLTELLGRSVTEHCQRTDSPRCCFHIATNHMPPR